MKIGTPRFEGPAVALRGVIGPVLPLQNNAEVEMRLSIIGLDRDPRRKLSSASQNRSCA
jgi:hypothetical protein